MLNNMKSILSYSYRKISEEYREEFSTKKIKQNFARTKNIAIFLLVFNLILIIIDINNFRSLWGEIPAYKNTFYLHVLCVFVLITYFFLIFIKDRFSKNQLKYEKLLNRYTLIFGILWCVFISLNAQLIHNQISAYIIGIFCIASVLLLTPLECIAIFTITFIIFITGLFFIQDDPQQLSGSIINSSFLLILAYFVSKLNFLACIENFKSKKIIMKQNIELKKNDKLKTIFFANISHDLKTPLNLIYSAEQLLVAYCDNPQEISADQKIKIKRYFNIIKQNCFRLMRLINNLIDITKMDIGEYKIYIENNDIVKIVRDIIYSISEYIEEKGLHLNFSSEMEKKIIACDPDTIERILLNLISNSIKFTPLNGVISVRIYMIDERVAICVEDTGVGIPSEVQDAVFDRFYQVDNPFTRRKEGSGIGLSLVKYLVEMHAGTISLESESGKGSKFVIELPARIIGEDDKEAGFRELSNGQLFEKIKVEFSDIHS